MDSNKKLKDFALSAGKTFDTAAGKRTLAYLKETYVDGSSVDANPHLTYYKLGQKELIQGLIELIKNPDSLDDIVLTTLHDDVI